jgi:hypothetical protein
VIQWGGEASPPAAATNVVAIAAGADHDLALCADGSVVGWGANYYGQATVPPNVTNAIGIAAGGDLSLALLADGTLVAWGNDESGQAAPPAQATNAGCLAAGYAHGLALTGMADQPFSPSATLGDFILLHAPGSPGIAAQYQWQLNGIDISGATNATLAVGAVSWTNAGIYRVVIRNPLGTVIGPPTVLSVLRTPLRFDGTVLGVQTNNLRLRLLGASGTGNVVVYASSNLVDWVPLFENSPAIGTLEFADPWSASTPARFYRAAEIGGAGPLTIQPLANPGLGGGFPLRVTGLTAQGPVTIYASTNLANWEPVFTNPPTIGPLQFQESLPQGEPCRFYRAAEAR